MSGTSAGPHVNEALVCTVNCNKDFFAVWDIINKTALGTLISLFGLITNTVTLIALFRQGFSDAMNVSLLGQTVSDMGLLIAVVVQNMVSHPLIVENVDISYAYADIGFLPPGILSYYFTRTTCYIMIFILVQRCLCIALPFKINFLLTPKRSGIILLVIFIGTFFFHDFAQAFGEIRIGWKFSPEKNRTIIGLLFTEKWIKLNNAATYVSAVSQIASFIIIVLGTAILVIQLKQKTKWRDSAVALASDKLKTISKRDNKLGVMVVILSGIFIVCYIPSTIGIILSFITPSIGYFSTYGKVYLFIWSLGLIFEVVNASVSIIVYYKTSSKYRKTLDNLMSVCTTGEKTSK